VRPLIEGHLAVYGVALDQLERAHQRIADITDLDLSGETRPAAVWQVAGRCIGFARAVLVLAREGIGDETPPLNGDARGRPSPAKRGVQRRGQTAVASAAGRRSLQPGRPWDSLRSCSDEPGRATGQHERN
jgi:hypothetical protein